MTLALPLHGRISELSPRFRAITAGTLAFTAFATFAASSPTHVTGSAFRDPLTQVSSIRAATSAPVTTTPPAPKPVVAAQAAAPTPAQPAPAPPQPFQMYDSTTPSSIPAGAAAVAVYANGSYAASPSQVAGKPYVLWIDTQASDPKANALDVEQGDASPSQVPGWVAAHDAQTSTNAIVYTYPSQWSAVQQAVSTLPGQDQARVKYWIADPTGTPHNLPGAAATQWGWTNSYDESTVNSGT